MSHDIPKPIPQGSNGTQDTENSRIAAIANQLERLCTIHEAKLGTGQSNVNRFEAEQRVAEQIAKEQGFSFYGFAGDDGRSVQPVIIQPNNVYFPSLSK